MRVVAIVGDADMFCVRCARARYGDSVVNAVLDGTYRDEYTGLAPQDNEGNELGAVLDISESVLDIDTQPDRYGNYPARNCGACGEPLIDTDYRAPIVLHPFPDMGCYADNDGTCYSLIDGSVNWPEWPESCSCGAGLPDVCEGNCPECGEPYWHLIAESCSECGDYIPQDAEYWLCLDGGETFHKDCVTTRA